MLDYEYDILHKITTGGTLVLPALGLNVQNVIKQFLSFYDDERGILIALNAGKPEYTLLSESGLCHTTNISTLLASQRKASYENGGIFYGSSRIFIADFLNNIVDTKRISTIILFNAECIQDDGKEAFILYMFKKNNIPGLVVAFVSNVSKLQSQQLFKIRSYTQTSQVLLYPRFHDKIVQSFPELLAAKLYIRQSSIIEEITLLLSDLVMGVFKLKYPGTSTVACASILIRYSDCRELRNFKDLFYILFTCDSLCFYKYYKRILEQTLRFNDKDAWVHTPASCILAEKAEEYLRLDIRQGFRRETGLNMKKVKRCIEVDELKNSKMEDKGINEEEVLEYFITQPFLEDIPVEADFFSTETENSSEDTTSGLLTTAHSLFTNESNRDGCSKEIAAQSSLNDGLFKRFYMVNAKINKIVKVILANRSSKIICVLSNNIAKPMLESIIKCVVEDIPVKFCSRQELEERDLSDAEIIILPSPDLPTIRRVESMAHCNASLKVFILVFKDSLEEHLYLLEMKEEKNIFERFIEEQALLPLANPLPQPLDIGCDAETEYEITVDSREMVAKLPYYLYRAGNNLKINTLKIGDYILGRICVERKAIEDLKGSLNTGRLYSQARRMAHAYSNPVLLIEFEEGTPTLLPYEVPGAFGKSIIARFCVFLIHFNRFRVLWSNSNIFSVEIIRDLQNREMGDAEHSLGTDPTLYEILLSIPGVNNFNIKNILREYGTLEELAKSTLEKLESVIKDKERSKKIYDFFRENL
ncbi:DNA excision repair protein ERCC-4 [Pancytospora epiphaga]|nr:DNA excision repair protein ERCC-4 [Pancytospora epiphaga]